jgi:hypothetical protein
MALALQRQQAKFDTEISRHTRQLSCRHSAHLYPEQATSVVKNQYSVNFLPDVDPRSILDGSSYLKFLLALDRKEVILVRVNPNPTFFQSGSAREPDNYGQWGSALRATPQAIVSDVTDGKDLQTTVHVPTVSSLAGLADQLVT